ncbi:MAG: hypothetical protein AB1815_05800 [Bacillota bacterium]
MVGGINERAMHPVEIAAEIFSLMSKKKNQAEKLLDLTYEQKHLLEQGRVDEFITLIQMRQEVISETDAIDKIIGQYPKLQETALNYLASNDNDNAGLFYEQKIYKESALGVFSLSTYLNQIEEMSRDIKKIYLKVQQLEKQNEAQITKLMNDLKRDLASLQGNRAGQSAYDRRLKQQFGAFLDQKK